MSPLSMNVKHTEQFIRAKHLNKTFNNFSEHNISEHV